MSDIHIYIYIYIYTHTHTRSRWSLFCNVFFLLAERATHPQRNGDNPFAFRSKRKIAILLICL